MARHACDRAEEMATRARDKAEEVARQARERAEEMARHACEKCEEMARQACDRAEDMARHACETCEAVARHAWTLVHHHHLPKWLRDNEFLTKGHRPQLNSFCACFRSIFRVHTETGNIWTHLLGKCNILHSYSCFAVTVPDLSLNSEDMDCVYIQNSGVRGIYSNRSTHIFITLHRCRGKYTNNHQYARCILTIMIHPVTVLQEYCAEKYKNAALKILTMCQIHSS